MPVYFSSMTLEGLYNSIVLCLLVALGEVAEASKDSEMGSATGSARSVSIGDVRTIHLDFIDLPGYASFAVVYAPRRIGEVGHESTRVRGIWCQKEREEILVQTHGRLNSAQECLK